MENEEETKGKNECKVSSLKNQMASDAINQYMEGKRKKKKLLEKRFKEITRKKVQGD